MSSDLEERLKRGLDRERTTVRLQRQNIAELEEKIAKYEETIDQKEQCKETDTLKFQNEDYRPVDSSQEIYYQLESVIEENHMQIKALRNTVKGYEKKSAEDQQEIYRLQDTIQELQLALKNKSNIVDSQTITILKFKNQIERFQLQQKKGVATVGKIISKNPQKKTTSLRQQNIDFSLISRQKKQNTQTMPSLGKENSIVGDDFQTNKSSTLQPPAVIRTNVTMAVLPQAAANKTTAQISLPAVQTIKSVCSEKDKRHVHGETCMGCEKFYETEPLADVNNRNIEYSTSDRIQLHSRHRNQPRQRATTPPGFWDMEFGSPEDQDNGRHLRRLI
ncbi:hypothetical protein BY458DRAFT_501130 [Sporodiniella umbellata]|nr:hypothetical protein BY458DRAFT_501130 [Sporodiniella umbellata]